MFEPSVNDVNCWFGGYKGDLIEALDLVPLMGSTHVLDPYSANVVKTQTCTCYIT